MGIGGYSAFGEERGGRESLTGGRTVRQSARRIFSASIVCLAVVMLPASASGQLPAQVRPHLDWQSAETRHFVFHYPAEMEQWTLDVAARMEAVHDAVSRYVGWAP